jgi:hypothetical protein
MKNGRLKVLAICFSLLFLTACSSKLDKEQRMVQQKVTQKTAHLVKEHIDSLSQMLSYKLTKSEDVTEKTLLDLQRKYNSVSALILQNGKGKIVKAVPEEFKNQNIESGQVHLRNENFKLLTRSKKVQFSDTIFGLDSVKYLSFQVPLLDEAQNLYGVISVILNSKYLFKEIERKCCFPIPYSLWIMDKKAIVLYHSDYEKIGMNLTAKESLQQCPALKELHTKMMQNDISYQISSYKYRDFPITKLFTWHAVSVLDSKWWISLIRVLERRPTKKATAVYLLSTLRTYAVKDTLINAIMDKGWEKADGILKEIYQLNSQVYAVQIADENGKVVSGWPPGNRTIGYSYTMKKSKNFDNALKNILISKEEKIITSPLIEGGKGKFTLIPIKINEEIISVLYSIEIEGN